MSYRTTFVYVVLCSVLMLPSTAPAQAPAKPKLSASAVQIAMVEAGDIQIPAEFRFAVYERLVERVRESGAFQKVYRTGDRAADGVTDLVTLHTKVQGFQEGSQTKRELTTVFGATKVEVAASVTARDGHTLMDQKITGRVRFFGENLGVTNDLAKRIAKLLGETF
ncbi:MAG TPA: hypothetical protein VK708_09125 [Bryobacteraceae bacterium]|jgi:hypothetical protein|nr:hypothetical protein [Bryobacteraceae bacterium]